MADLTTDYMGLELKNPLVVGSSDLTMSVDKIRQCEDAGAGAVVLKSLFEEQLEDEVRTARSQHAPTAAMNIPCSSTTPEKKSMAGLVTARAVPARAWPLVRPRSRRAR